MYVNVGLHLFKAALSPSETCITMDNI